MTLSPSDNSFGSMRHDKSFIFETLHVWADEGIPLVPADAGVPGNCGIADRVEIATPIISDPLPAFGVARALRVNCSFVTIVRVGAVMTTVGATTEITTFTVADA